MNVESLRSFDEKWKILESRMEMVCGKDVLKILRAKVNDLYSVTLTEIRIIDEFDNDEIPQDLRGLINSLECYRTNQ